MRLCEYVRRYCYIKPKSDARKHAHNKCEKGANRIKRDGQMTAHRERKKRVNDDFNEDINIGRQINPVSNGAF